MMQQVGLVLCTKLLALLLLCVRPQWLATVDVCVCDHIQQAFPSTNIYRREILYMVAHGTLTITFCPLLPNVYHVPLWHPGMVAQMAQKTCTIRMTLWLYWPCRRILWAWIHVVRLAWPDGAVCTSVTTATWPGCAAIASWVNWPTQKGLG